VQKRRHFSINSRFAFDNCTIQVEYNQLFHCSSGKTITNSPHRATPCLRKVWLPRE
jgi:hypothetical protein